MQSRLLAASLLALAAGSAAAQSSVNIYGRLNVSVERQKVGGVSSTDMVNSSSRVGLKGSEDLGGGMTAGFVLEHGFDPRNGTAGSSFWGRQSEVNLGSSSYGQLRLGNYTSEAYFATADYVSLHNHDTGSSSDAFYADTRGFAQSNKVGYMSPAVGNTVFHAAVNTRQDGEADRTYELAANHDAGPLHLGAGYQKTGDKNQFALRGLYELGAFTVGGYVQRDENVTAAGSRTNVRLVGMYTVGATELHLNVGRAGDTGSVANSAAKQFTLGANYNLSQRTKLYTFYTKVDDGAAALYGGDRSALALGLRHNF